MAFRFFVIIYQNTGTKLEKHWLEKFEKVGGLIGHIIMKSYIIRIYGLMV